MKSFVLLFFVITYVGAEWGLWSNWTKCYDPGDGAKPFKVRIRKCSTDQCEGKGFDRVEDCQLGDGYCGDKWGNWTEWSSWSTCSTTCIKGTKTRERSREAEGAHKDKDGHTECTMRERENRDCEGLPEVCSRDGGWSEWDNWGKCTINSRNAPCSCTIGMSFRQRHCTNPEPLGDGQVCKGSSYQQNDCQMECPGGIPYDGKWSKWTPQCNKADSGQHDANRRRKRDDDYNYYGPEPTDDPVERGNQTRTCICEAKRLGNLTFNCAVDESDKSIDTSPDRRTQTRKLSCDDDDYGYEDGDYPDGDYYGY